jgi:phosphoribosyl 1,2-cyclic phosphate phosphodiesterase
VDCGPDFRSQMLRAGIGHLDAILVTHNHKDHIGGLDDVRSLNFIDRRPAEIYCEPKILDDLKREYPYAFAYPRYPGAPEWHIHLIDTQPFMVRSSAGDRELVWVHDVGYGYRAEDGSVHPAPADNIDRASDSGEGVRVIPIRGIHGKMPILGFRIGRIAYLTDISYIPEEEMPKLEGLEHVSLNTVSYAPHHSHLSLDEALALADRIGATHTWLTHLSHNFPVHEQFAEDLRRLCSERGIRSDVQPAFDGLVISA